MDEAETANVENQARTIPPLKRPSLIEKQRLFFGLPRRSPLRRLFDPATGAIDASEQAIETVLQTLCLPYGGAPERNTAIQILEYLPLTLQQRQAFAQELGKIANGAAFTGIESSFGLWLRCLARSVPFLALLGALIVLLSLPAYFLAFSSPLLILGQQLEAWTFASGREKAVELLGKWRVPESVGALARASVRAKGRLREKARIALLATLPNLTNDHYGRLDSSLTPDLAHLLGSFSEASGISEALALEILSALEKVGDGRAYAEVQRLAQDALPSAIQEEAARILPVLRMRWEQAQASENLLRASDAPPTAPTQLLRPAMPQAPREEPQQLLRPSQGSD